ncbi:MAG: hypothetical protein M1825_004289 [Sarcosagium campestre]|nr:MAG: hypothetical protein M1825_004289 [Sarcosagium campestre]
MNDDVDAAEAGLAKGNSSFHKLGKGMVTFLRATLGFEQDVMREASERLAEAEASSWNDQRRAQRGPQHHHSAIYLPGTEFALCNAQSQLMSAVVAVLNESLTESLKGFYKLRKAYTTLDGIMEAENKFIRQRSGLPGSQQTTSRNSYESQGAMPGGFEDESQAPSVAPNSTIPSRPTDSADFRIAEIKPPMTPDLAVSNSDDEEEFFDADESLASDARTPNVSLQSRTDALKDQYSVAPATPRNHKNIDHDPDDEVFADPVDVFIHTGANLCFGLLLLLISMIPPALGKLLYIIGFKGDRERAIKMIWQASKFDNINGAMAGLVLLGYYNGIIGFCDILPNASSASANSYPKERCEQLLADMRARYPKSHLWLLEEARMAAANKNLDRALALLEKDSKSQLQQVEALAMFERSLNAMYSHRHELTSECFLKCVELNNWSHALYYYIAGAAHLQLYRQHQKSQSKDQMKIHADKAEALFKEVPFHVGKKKFMARQLPFDVFVGRKVQKWQNTAHEHGIRFADAVGVSPLEEMLYFWNGYKRMPKEKLDVSLSALLDSPAGAETSHRETADELAINALLRAVIHRHQGDFELSRHVLKTEVLSIDKASLKGHLRDDWTAPCACYEMAVLCWEERNSLESEPDAVHAKVRECEDWIEKVARWDTGYDLDTRYAIRCLHLL